jgi:hypothetical protein
MNFGVILASAFLFFSAPAQSTPGVPVTTLRNSFVVAAETVVDDADALDVKADPAHFDGPMAQLKAAQANLTSMADGDREHGIASAMQDMVFQISLCRIQAKDNAPTDKCEAQVSAARTNALQLLGKRKNAGSWSDGAPA